MSHELDHAGRQTPVVRESLRTDLWDLYTTLRGGMNASWHRDLPFTELLFDRWERARSLGFGDQSSIYHESYVYGDVSIGEHSWVGPLTLLDGSGGLTIGDYCVVSAGVHIYTHDTVKWAVSGGREAYERAPVTVGSYTYIGAQCVVLKGVVIGEHSVIGAGSIINRDIPPLTVAVGSPCRPIGHVSLADDGTVHLEYQRSRRRR